MRTLKGQCRCRAVTYEVADDFAYALNCHCSNCRRATGSAFKPLAGIGSDRIAIIDGGENVAACLFLWSNKLKFLQGQAYWRV